MQSGRSDSSQRARLSRLYKLVEPTLFGLGGVAAFFAIWEWFGKGGFINWAPVVLGPVTFPAIVIGPVNPIFIS